MSMFRRRHWLRRSLLIASCALTAVIVTLLVIAQNGVTMRAQTTVSLSPEQTWMFFEDVENLAGWDRSVARVEPTSPPPYGVGSTFDTFSPAPPGAAEQRSSYRVVELRPVQSARIDLVDSSTFQRASWNTRLEPTADGTRVVIEVEFSPKPQYFFLVPVLYLNQGNLDTDMEYLRTALEDFGRATTTGPR